MLARWLTSDSSLPKHYHAGLSTPVLCRLFSAAVMLHVPILGQASHLAALPPWPNTTNTRKTRSQLHSGSILMRHASHYLG